MLPVKNFTDFIAQNDLFTPERKILAAVSGGMDSVLMVHLLKAAAFNFSIAHCNFQLRGDEALADQEFANSLADKLRVPFHTINFDTKAYAGDKKISIQMAARELRYQWFLQISRQSGYDVIALAHHQNDAIETILLNLTRGTGIAGLHGILPKSGPLVRPMLFLRRDEIASIIVDNKLAYVEDSSNASVKYARNKLRLEVIPKLKELNPTLESTFENNLAHFRDLELLLQQQITGLKEELVFEDEEVHLPLAVIKKLKPQSLLLYGLLQDYGVNRTTIYDIISALDKHSGRTFETTFYRLVLDRDMLIITKKQLTTAVPVSINNLDHTVYYHHYKVTILHDDSALIIKDNPLAVSVDADLIIYPLNMRAWQQGDQFYPLGMKTAKKLSDFFIHEKVPLHKKVEIPLLINGNGEIMWVGGYRLDERYKVSRKTKKVTIFELFKL